MGCIIIENFSYIIAVALGLSAILSPIATTLINNYYLAKQKQIELYELAKRKALEDFIKTATILRLNDSSSAIKDFYCSANNLYIYFKDIPDEEIDNLVQYKNDNNFFNLLSDITESLSEQISKE